MAKIFVIIASTNNYIKYVPFYIYSLLYQNKGIDYFTFYVITNEENINYLNRLQTFITNLDLKFDILSTELNNLTICNQPYILFYRFLINPDIYKDYDYVHVSDVDLIHAVDKFINIKEYLQYNSYCNHIRNHYERYGKYSRFEGGSHTFKVDKYTQKYGHKIKNITIDYLKELNIIDELFLGFIHSDDIEELNYIKNNPTNFDRLGGLHLGLFKRSKNRVNLNQHLSQSNIDNLKNIINDNIFKKICIVYKHPYIKILLSNFKDK